MQKAVTHIRAVLGRILVIGLSLQIVFGLAWMCCSFTGVQWFAESSFYVKVSESLIYDEYTGILYPLLLMLTGKKYLLLCLLQLVAALGAGYVFAGAVGVKSHVWRIWGSLVLLTYPMAMQCHMAVLPNSFTFSCFLLLLACVLAAVKKERNGWRRELLGAHVFWLLTALLQPDYLYLGAVPVILFWIYDAVKYRKSAGRRVSYHFLLAAVFAGMIVTTGSLTSTEGYYARAQKSVASTVFQRVGWSGLAKYYMEWPEDVRDAAVEEAFLQTVNYAENMELLLLPEIERRVGTERAREFYVEISKRALTDNYSRIIYEVLWDTVGNVFPPVIVQEILEGRGYISYCARNYETMGQDCPMLTKLYMQYEAWWFMVGIVLTACIWLLGILQKSKTQIFPLILCVLSAAFMTVWYVFENVGAWDYKKGVFVGVLWIIGMIVMSVRSLEEEQ